MLSRTPNGLHDIIVTFGALGPDFEAKNIVLFDLPYPMLYDGNIVKRSRCHRLVVDNFIAVFREIEKKNLTGQVMNYGGIYNARPIRGATKASTHSWGIAIDLEPSKYPLGSSRRFDPQIVEIFKRHGFFYGGDFAKRKDPMHFQFATGY